jgi:hypothetical protein
MLRVWCEARAVRRDDAPAPAAALAIVFCCAAPLVPVAAARDGWSLRGSAGGRAGDRPGASWLDGRAADGRLLPLVRCAPGRLEIHLCDATEPSGDPASFAVSWGRMLDGLLLAPRGGVARAARGAGGAAGDSAGPDPQRGGAGDAHDSGPPAPDASRADVIDAWLALAGAALALLSSAARRP